MTVIKNPTIINKNKGESQLRELPLRGDIVSAKKYLEDNNLGTFNSFTTNKNVRFSNNGGIAYNYYLSGQTYTTYWGNTGVTYEWRTGFGYESIIDSIDYT
jgi:hypothetical protein